MKSALHMALLIVTIYEYFFPRKEEEKEAQGDSSYVQPDLEIK